MLGVFVGGGVGSKDEIVFDEEGQLLIEEALVGVDEFGEEDGLVLDGLEADVGVGLDVDDELVAVVADGDAFDEG